jgi:hypothetical protein
VFLPAREEEPSQDLNTTHIPVVLSTVVLLPSMGCCFPTSQGRVGICHGCSESMKPFGGKWGGGDMWEMWGMEDQHTEEEWISTKQYTSFNCSITRPILLSDSQRYFHALCWPFCHVSTYPEMEIAEQSRPSLPRVPDTELLQGARAENSL